ncbi:MAG: hypothetical protein KQH57_14610 [Actinomycetales bacterium]|nr:hypothetical protein [Actinomycetales bacterium]
MAVLVLTFIGVAVPVSDQGGYRSFPGYMAFLAVGAWAMVLAATTRIEAQGSDLVLVNFATVRRLPRSEIVGVDGTNGVVVHTTSGTYEATGYGGSLAQNFVHSRRYARVAARIQEWAGVGGTATRPPTFEVLDAVGRSGRHRQIRVPARPRRLLVIGLPVAAVATQALGVVLWLNSDTLLGLLLEH